jgi:hypothetical protein
MLNPQEDLRVFPPKVAPCVPFVILSKVELGCAPIARIVLDLHLTNPNMAMREFLSERNELHGR